MAYEDEDAAMRAKLAKLAELQADMSTRRGITVDLKPVPDPDPDPFERLLGKLVTLMLFSAVTSSISLVAVIVIILILLLR